MIIINISWNFVNYKYSDKINEKEYISETNIKPYEYISRRDIKKIRICILMIQPLKSNTMIKLSILN